MARQHIVPTHLGVVDKIALGLTLPEFMLLSLGLGGVGLLYTTILAGLVTPIRVGLTLILALVILAAVFIKPGGMSLYHLALLRYSFAVRPKEYIFGTVELVEYELEAADYEDELEEYEACSFVGLELTEGVVGR